MQAAAAPAKAATPADDTVKILYEPPNGQPISLDVVFFHGLQLGDYKDAWQHTWTNKDGVLWPAKWLGAEDFPSARIMSISYDSQAKDGRMTMDEIGKHLLHHACWLVSGGLLACLLQEQHGIQEAPSA